MYYGLCERELCLIINITRITPITDTLTPILLKTSQVTRGATSPPVSIGTYVYIASKYSNATTQKRPS